MQKEKSHKRLFLFGCNEAHLRCMKNEAAFDYEASILLAERLVCASLHASVASASWRNAPLGVCEENASLTKVRFYDIITPKEANNAMEQNEYIVLIFGAIVCFLWGQIEAAGNIGNRPCSIWYDTHFLIEKKGICKLIYFKPKHFERYTLYEVIAFFASYAAIFVFLVLGIFCYVDCISLKVVNLIVFLSIGLILSSGLAIVLINDIGSHGDRKKKFYLENGERETRPELSESLLPKDNKYRYMAMWLWMNKRNNSYFTIYNLWDSYYIRLKEAANDIEKSNQVNLDYIEYFKNIDQLVVIKENKNGSLQLKIQKQYGCY